MPASQDLLFGQLAVEMRFCTAEQVERCAAIQAQSERPLPLGRQLVQEGYLTEDQHSKVLARQRQNMLRPDPSSRAPKGDLLFGRLVVREKMAGQEQVNACLREQAKRGERRTLGEVMIARRILTPAQVESLLALQSKTIMRCGRCAISLTVHSTSKNPRKIACPRCRGPLEVAGSGGADTAADGELDTSVRNRPVPDPPRPAPAGKIPPACLICTHPFVGSVDADGRAECLTCHARFVI